METIFNVNIDFEIIKDLLKRTVDYTNQFPYKNWKKIENNYLTRLKYYERIHNIPSDCLIDILISAQSSNCDMFNYLNWIYSLNNLINYVQGSYIYSKFHNKIDATIQRIFDIQTDVKSKNQYFKNYINELVYLKSLLQDNSIELMSIEEPISKNRKGKKCDFLVRNIKTNNLIGYELKTIQYAPLEQMKSKESITQFVEEVARKKYEEKTGGLDSLKYKIKIVLFILMREELEDLCFPEYINESVELHTVGMTKSYGVNSNSEFKLLTPYEYNRMLKISF